MAIKEFSFHQQRPLSEHVVQFEMLDSTEYVKKHPRLPRIKTNDKDLVIVYKMTGKEVVYYLMYRDACEGVVGFEKVSRGYEGLRKQLGGITLLEPHSMMSEVLRGKGYALFLYEQALKKNALVSDHHTAEAAALWERVAKRLKLKVRYFDYMKDEWVDKSDADGEDVVKVLVR